VGKNGERQQKLIAWAIFFLVLLTHFFLAKKWTEEHFVRSFLNTDIFLDTVSRIYQKVVNSQCSALDFSVFAQFCKRGVGRYWPPLPAMIDLWTLLTLPHRWFFLPNLFYLAATMLGISFSSFYLCGNRFYSMLAAAIYSCYWFVMVQLGANDTPLAATACIAWGFYGYLQSEYFTKFWPTVAMSVFMVLALYCDRFSPDLFLFFLFLVPQNFKHKRSLIFMALALIVIVACAWPFYGSWMRVNMSAHGFANKVNDMNDGPFLAPAEIYKVVACNPLFLFTHLSFYFTSLTEKVLGCGFTALLILGVIFFRRLNKPEAKIVWIAMAVPWITFTFVIKKNPVYIFPLCIYFAMITAIGISLVRQKIVRYVLIGLIAGLAAIQYCILFWASDPNATLFFSNRFSVMCHQGAPRLFLYGDSPLENDVSKKIFPMLAQVNDVCPGSFASGADNPRLIVDLQEHNMQHSAVFFLRLIFPKVQVIDAALPGASCGDPGQESLYLLSSKKKYEGGFPVLGIEGCSWHGIKPEHRLADNDAVLYRLR